MNKNKQKLRKCPNKTYWYMPRVKKFKNLSNEYHHKHSKLMSWFIPSIQSEKVVTDTGANRKFFIITRTVRKSSRATLDFQISHRQLKFHWSIAVISCCNYPYTDCLTLLWRRPLWYRNRSIDLLCKSMVWFLYDNGLRHEKVNTTALLKIKVIDLLTRAYQSSRNSKEQMNASVTQGFKVGLSALKEIVFLLQWKPLKMIKNAFYFVLKVLFPLHFLPCRKTAWKES